MTINLHQLMSRRRAAMTPAQRARDLAHSVWTAKETAKRTLFVSVYGMDGCVHPFTLAGKRKRVDWKAALAVGETPLKWNIQIHALCRDSAGKDYIYSPDTISLPEPIQQSAIDKSLSEYHFDWVKENVNKSHLLTVGWIATTASEPSPKLAFDIFDSIGAFDAFDIVQPTEDGGYLTVRKGE